MCQQFSIGQRISSWCQARLWRWIWRHGHIVTVSGSSFFARKPSLSEVPRFGTQILGPALRQRCRHVAFRPLCLMTRFTSDLLGCFDHFWGGSCQHQGFGKSQGRARVGSPASGSGMSSTSSKSSSGNGSRGSSSAPSVPPRRLD